MDKQPHPSFCGCFVCRPLRTRSLSDRLRERAVTAASIGRTESAEAYDEAADEIARLQRMLNIAIEMLECAPQHNAYPKDLFPTIQWLKLNTPK